MASGSSSTAISVCSTMPASLFFFRRFLSTHHWFSCLVNAYGNSQYISFHSTEWMTAHFYKGSSKKYRISARLKVVYFKQFCVALKALSQLILYVGEFHAFVVKYQVYSRCHYKVSNQWMHNKVSRTMISNYNQIQSHFFEYWQSPRQCSHHGLQRHHM